MSDYYKYLEAMSIPELEKELRRSNVREEHRRAVETEIKNRQAALRASDATQQKLKL